jgi:hypothetical protein
MSPKPKEEKSLDDFREWLSDNLRYIMLIGGILILLLLIFFGIRAVSGIINSGEDATKEQVDGSDVQGDDMADASNTTTPTETPAEPLEKNAYPEINTLIQSYYDALGRRDVTTLKTLVDDFSPSEEAKIENAQYIDGYSNVEVYTKKGLTQDAYVVIAQYNYICTGVTTPVPALSQLYVVKDESGYKISQKAEDDTEIQSYIAEVLQDEDIQDLIQETEDAYQEAQETDPELKTYLENLGKETTPTPAPTEAESDSGENEGEYVTASDYVYVRSGPGGDSQIIGGLDIGDQVKKLGEDGFWVMIEYEGQTGYVYSEYVY